MSKERNPLIVNKRLHRLFQFLAVWILLTFAAQGTNAQSSVKVTVNEIDNQNFPRLSVFLSVTDPNGFPVEGIKPDNFSISEDGKEIEDFEVSSIRNEFQPLAIVIAMDTSGSMDGEPLVDAKNAAVNFINSLPSHDKVSLVSFSEDVEIVQDLSNERVNTIESLHNLSAGGGTALFDSLVDSADVLKNASERRIIILLTDGQESGASFFDFNRAIDEVTRWSIPVYPIGFGDVDAKELGQIAILTGGFLQVEPNSSTLEKAMADVLLNLRDQYKIDYQSSLLADDLEHDFGIEIDFEGWHVESSRAFVALPREVSVSLPGYATGDVIGGKLRFTPDVVSPTTLERLDLSMDEEIIDSVLSEPFEIVWDASQVTEGLHHFTFSAEDRAGNIGIYEIDFEIKAPIVINAISPQPGDELRGVITINAEIDSLAKISNVEFFINDESFASFSDAPFSADWDLSDGVVGEQVIRIVVSDVIGNQAEKEINLTGAYSTFSGGFVLIIGILIAAIIIIPIVVKRRKPSKSARLIEIEGHNPSLSWSLQKTDTTLGRIKAENTIHLKGRNASRFHAVITCQNGDYFIRPRKPQNPVLVNSASIREAHKLQSGDIIQLGDSKFKFEG